MCTQSRENLGWRVNIGYDGLQRASVIPFRDDYMVHHSTEGIFYTGFFKHRYG